MLSIFEFDVGKDNSIICLALVRSAGDTHLGAVLTRRIYILIRSCSLELLWKHFPVNNLLSNDFSYVAIAITADDIAVKRINLQSFLPVVEQAVTCYYQMLHSVMQSHTIIRFVDLLHDDPLHFI